MYGYFYSVKQNYSFSKKEYAEMFWTSLAFAFILTSYLKKFLFKPVIIQDTVLVFIATLIFTFIALYMHVAAQKLIAIKLGYKATYTYWLNGILICVFLNFMTLGLIPLLSTLILPGAVTLEHVSTMRLGKFRFGMNLKDIARVSLAGPLAHVILTMIAGALFLATGKSDVLLLFITINLMLAIYSMLPIPKIDFPSKMDSASDGLGIFFFSRTMYVLSISTIIVFAILAWIANIFSIIFSFVVGSIFATIYLIYVEQKN